MEYLHTFNQLARYAPEDVASDENKQERFLEGLNDEIAVLLIAQEHSDFQQLVSKAIRQEGKLQEMESRKLDLFGRCAELAVLVEEVRETLW